MALEEIDLILHQRDEGGYHYGQSVECKRRQLVAKRFAATRGEDRERRSSGEKRADHARLSITERIKAEVLP